VAMIYEGTNEIQAIDLLVRKLAKDEGAAMRTLLDELRQAVPASGALAAAVRDLPGVEIRALYDRYPDFDIDVAAEQALHDPARAAVEAEIGKAGAKLDNPSFVQRAPAAVVAQERARLEAFRQTLARLRDQANRLRSSP